MYQMAVEVRIGGLLEDMDSVSLTRSFNLGFEKVIRASVFEKWFQTFQHKLQNDPWFWKE
jgi:hypothetical protein